MIYTLHSYNPICKIIPLVPRKDNAKLFLKKTFLQNVQFEIEKNISDENFGILELCQAIGISRSQLHNKIKAQTGLSTSIFIRSLRLKKANALINNSDLNISEIAYEVGFKDPSYFSRLYSEEYGFPPSVKRKITFKY